MRKEVLKRDARHGLRFTFDLDVLFGFDSLVKAITPSPARHQAAGELIDDNHLPLLDHIITVTLVKNVCAKGLLHVMIQFQVSRVVKIAAVQQLLDLQDARFSQCRSPVLLIHREVARRMRLPWFFPFDDFAALQKGDDAVYLVVFVGRFFAGPGDDQRRTRFINQDRIHLIHDREIEIALDIILQAELHVVAKIIEPEFVVRPVRNVGVVRHPPLPFVQIVHNVADR